MRRARHAVFLAVERLLLWVVVPQLRARLLGLLGADIGRNVRISEIRLFNLESGFANLRVADDVHIGPGTRIDLSDRVEIEEGAVLSPECLVLTHIDVGEHHDSPMVAHFPTDHAPVRIGRHAYLGARATVLAGVEIAPMTAVAAHALVTRSTTGNELVGGVPARHLRPLDAGEPAVATERTHP